jgi:MFS family permease
VSKKTVNKRKKRSLTSALEKKAVGLYSLFIRLNQERATMAETSRNTLNWKIMAPVAVFATFQSAFMTFSTVMADIAKAFPNESTTVLQMILTVPSLMSIPVSLLVGILASYIQKKQLVIFALICELIGGCIPLAVHSTVSVLLVSSAFIGIGQGFLISISSALLAEHFDGNTRGWAMGLRQAAASIGTTGLTVLTGFLCEMAWWKAYFIYLLVIPILILTVILLPKGNLDSKLVGKGVGLKGLKRVFTPGAVYWCVMAFFLGCFSYSFYLNIGMSIASKGLGGSSVVGLATAWGSVLTIVVAVGFGFILRLFKRFTMALGMLVFAAAFVTLFGAVNLTAIIIGGIINGVATGIQMPGSMQFLTESVDREASTMALAASNASTSLGITLSPLIVNAFSGLFGPINGTTGMIIAAGGYMIMLAVEVVRELAFNKNSTIGLSAAQLAQRAG